MKKLLFVLLFVINFNVFAVNPTQGPLQQDPSLCAYGYNSNCNNNTSNPKKIIIETTIVHKASKYGALAWNKKTGHLGGAVNMNSKAEAQRVAIQTCEQAGGSCEIIVWARNGCIAAAQGRKGKNKWMLFKNVSETPDKAEQTALNRCQAAGLKECRILGSAGCSIPDGMYN